MIERHETAAVALENERRFGTAANLIRLLVWTLGIRVVYLFAGYLLGFGAIKRFHVESATVAFVLVGLIWRIVQSRRERFVIDASPGPARWVWPLLCLAAVALYWQSWHVGLLSDDYVLVGRADEWKVGPVSPSLFRPLPLLIWSLVLNVGGGPQTLHLLNLFLHGTNAYLAAHVMFGWIRNRLWSILAGLITLAAPLSVEAVVWTSGVFDLLSTTLVLAAILISRRYDRDSSPSNRLLFLIVGVLALASKEAAATTALFVLLDAWICESRPPLLTRDIAVLLSIAAIFSVMRLTAAFGVAPPPMDKYVFQRAIFGTFGGLAVPWHIDGLGRFRWAALAEVCALICLLLLFFLDSFATRKQTRLVIGAAVWALLAIAPVFPILYISPDLQQSRYLYLSTVGWAGLIAGIGSSSRGRSGPLPLVAGAMLIGFGVMGTRLHIRPWNEAAQLRNKIEESALNSGLTTCPVARVRELPDSIRGAYIFRNGGSEAFRRDLHVNVILAEKGGGPCSFTWDETRQMFVSSPPIDSPSPH